MLCAPLLNFRGGHKKSTPLFTNYRAPASAPTTMDRACKHMPHPLVVEIEKLAGFDNLTNVKKYDVLDNYDFIL